jgi:hypothetical protein
VTCCLLLPQHKPEKCDKTAKQGDRIHVHYTGKVCAAEPCTGSTASATAGTLSAAPVYIRPDLRGNDHFNLMLQSNELLILTEQ